jgi:hypothetical protein
MALKYLMCIAGGAALGYAYAYSRMEREYQERLDRETEELRIHYRNKYLKKGAVADARAAQSSEKVSAEMAEDARKVYGGGESIVSAVVSSELSEVAKKGIVTGDISVPEEDENFVHDTQMPSEAQVAGAVSNALVDAAIAASDLVGRASKPVVNYNRISTPEKADIPEQTRTEASVDDEMAVEIETISQQAFIDNEFGYKQFSFTYFAGDDVLANEEDEPVTGPARDASVGSEIIKKLKVGREAMGGESVVYVRNRTGNWEFEITRSDGEYSKEVAAGAG